MEELLEALKEGDQERINNLAAKLFRRRAGGLNMAQVNEFERYAPCRIFTLESNEKSSFMAGIQYHDHTYMFG